MAVAYSTMLYAAPIWGDVLRYRKYRDALEKLQRKLAIRVCSAYRTTSTMALQVRADDVPIDLRVAQVTRKREMVGEDETE